MNLSTVFSVLNAKIKAVLRIVSSYQETLIKLLENHTRFITTCQKPTFLNTDII